MSVCARRSNKCYLTIWFRTHRQTWLITGLTNSLHPMFIETFFRKEQADSLNTV